MGDPECVTVVSLTFTMHRLSETDFFARIRAVHKKLTQALVGFAVSALAALAAQEAVIRMKSCF